MPFRPQDHHSRSRSMRREKKRCSSLWSPRPKLSSSRRPQRLDKLIIAIQCPSPWHVRARNAGRFSSKIHRAHSNASSGFSTESNKAREMDYNKNRSGLSPAPLPYDKIVAPSCQVLALGRLCVKIVKTPKGLTQFRVTTTRPITLFVKRDCCGASG